MALVPQEWGEQKWAFGAPASQKKTLLESLGQDMDVYHWRFSSLSGPAKAKKKKKKVVLLWSLQILSPPDPRVRKYRVLARAGQCPKLQL